jgi:hypothetical protein
MSRLMDYLGMAASALLEAEPFKSWKFDRTIENDLAERLIDYVCDVEGFSMTCDADDTIRSIFLQSSALVQAELNLPPQCGRSDVLASLGAPLRSGEAFKDIVLGEYGGWDRYEKERYSLHIEYAPRADRIKMVTLIRPDAIPKSR